MLEIPNSQLKTLTLRENMKNKSYRVTKILMQINQKNI